MTQESRRINWQINAGDPVTVDDITVTPRSQALTVRWPGGGWVWNRPVGLVIQQGQTDDESESSHIPIVDVTRVAQLALYGLSLAFLIAGLVLSIRKKKE